MHQAPAARKTLNVSLTPELQRFSGARVASGRDRTASEAVRAALRLLERDEAGLVTVRAHDTELRWPYLD